MPLLPKLTSDSLKDTPWSLLHLWQHNQNMLSRLAVGYVLPLFFEGQETGGHEGKVIQFCLPNCSGGFDYVILFHRLVASMTFRLLALAMWT